MFSQLSRRSSVSCSATRIVLQVEQLEDILAPSGIVVLGDPIHEGAITHPDSYSVAQNTSLNIVNSESGVMANDYISSPDDLVQLATVPTNGTIQLNADGTFDYTPNQDFNGVDSFEYLYSSSPSEDTEQVYIGVGDHEPFAVEDAFDDIDQTNYTPVIRSTKSVMTNDLLLDPSTATADIVSLPMNGHLAWSSEGMFVYTPNSGFFGVDSFQYQVNDAAGVSNVATVYLKVGMQASPPQPLDLPEGTPINDTLTTLTLAPWVQVNDLDVSINWGTETTSGNVVQTGGNQFGVSFPYTYPEDGEYGVRIEVTNTADGSTLLYDTVLDIHNVSPINVDGGDDITTNEGSAVSFTSSFEDPGTEDTHTYSWQVSSDNGDVISDGTSDTFGFTPGDNGTYTVTLTVTDDDGGVGSDTFNVYVDNVAPSLSIYGLDNALEREDYTLHLVASDVGLDTIESWQIDWGDGTPIETIQGNPKMATHTYLVPGTFEVKAFATDEDGSYTAENSKQVAVENVAPTLSPLSVTYHAGRMVTVSGEVDDGVPGGLTVTFDGVVSGTTTTNPDGSFSFSALASGLGLVTAIVVDSVGDESEMQKTAVETDPPEITSFIISHQFGNTYEFRGTVQDESPLGLVLTITGLASWQGGYPVEVEADGTFRVWIELEPEETGYVAANVEDPWGLSAPTVYSIIL
ncbi:MAG: Ig-like domain-containing protein [Gemmataceae bacterium]